jgi:ferredoxin
VVSCEMGTGVVEGTRRHPLRGIMSCRRRGACGRCESAQMMSSVSEVGPWCASKLRLSPEVRSGETRPSRGRGTVRSGRLN